MLILWSTAPCTYLHHALQAAERRIRIQNAHNQSSMVGVCSQAAVMGSGGRKLMGTANACGICGNELQDYSHLGDQVCSLPQHTSDTEHCLRSHMSLL